MFVWVTIEIDIVKNVAIGCPERKREVWGGGVNVYLFFILFFVLIEENKPLHINPNKASSPEIKFLTS